MNIYESISKVMADVGAVAKTDVNTYDKYKFRGIDAIYNALHPAMVKNHIFVVPEVLEMQREEKESQKGGLLTYTVVKVKYTFYAEDGTSIVAVVNGEGMDRGDKSSYKAMSGAFKYACFQTFCLPTEEAQDPETESPDPVRKKKAEPKAEAQVAAEAYPSREEMIEFIAANSKIGRDKIEALDDAKLMANYAVYEARVKGNG